MTRFLPTSTPIFFVVGLLSLPSFLGGASCPAIPNGDYNTNIAAHVVIEPGTPAMIQNGIRSGMAQWNDCLPNTYDWPRFQSNAGEFRIDIYYHDTGGPEACASYVDGNLCLWSSYEAQDGTIVDCVHSEAAVSDTVAHELGHYLGLDHSNCSRHIMGPLAWDSNGAIYTDYRISQEEKNLVDSVNTNDQEEFEEECQGDQGCGNQGGGSPIILDLGNDWFELTSLGAGVSFDIDGDWLSESVSWLVPGPTDAFLYRNRYKTPGVDDGSELFGDSTRSLLDGDFREHGYLVLGELDLPELGGNRNGWIDPGDAFFTSLGLWIDANHDGVSQTAELMSLNDAGVRRLAYRSRRSPLVDEHGNQFRFISLAWLERGGLLRPILTADVFLVVEND